MRDPVLSRCDMNPSSKISTVSGIQAYTSFANRTLKCSKEGGGDHGRSAPCGTSHMHLRSVFLERDQATMIETRTPQIRLFHPNIFRALNLI